VRSKKRKARESGLEPRKKTTSSSDVYHCRGNGDVQEGGRCGPREPRRCSTENMFSPIDRGRPSASIPSRRALRLVFTECPVRLANFRAEKDLDTPTRIGWNSGPVANIYSRVRDSRSRMNWRHAARQRSGELFRQVLGPDRVCREPNSRTNCPITTRLRAISDREPEISPLLTLASEEGLGWGKQKPGTARNGVANASSAS